MSIAVISPNVNVEKECVCLETIFLMLGLSLPQVEFWFEEF